MASRAQRGRFMSRGFLNLRIYRGSSVWLDSEKDVCGAGAIGRATIAHAQASYDKSLVSKVR